MDKILLVASNSTLRQLYHELLQSKNVEVMPLDNISDAIVLLMLHQYLVVVISIDEQIKDEVLVFLKLRDRHQNLNRTKIILLASDMELLVPHLKEKDFVLNSKDLSPQEISNQINSLLKLIHI